MSNVTQTQTTSATISVTGAGTPKITPLDITSTSSEFSHSLTNNLKQLMVRSRVGATLQYAWGAGETTTNYVTIEKKAVLELTNLNFVGKVLYLRADKVGVVEIQELY